MVLWNLHRPDEGGQKPSLKTFIKSQGKLGFDCFQENHGQPALNGVRQTAQKSPMLLTCLGKNQKNTLKCSSWMTEDL